MLSAFDLYDHVTTVLLFNEEIRVVRPKRMGFRVNVGHKEVRLAMSEHSCEVDLADAELPASYVLRISSPAGEWSGKVVKR